MRLAVRRTGPFPVKTEALAEASAGERATLREHFTEADALGDPAATPTRASEAFVQTVPDLTELLPAVRAVRVKTVPDLTVEVALVSTLPPPTRSPRTGPSVTDQNSAG